MARFSYLPFASTIAILRSPSRTIGPKTITRGLMYAGTERVTVSLWNVPDAETAQLMQQFYQSLWTGKAGHVEALRSAQLQMWKAGKHPYFWAAFGLQGEWRN